MLRIRRKRLPLKTVFYTSFLFLIVIPILVVLIISLLILNKQFKRQAIENVKRAQETIITELLSDINNMSMRLSHLIYTNNNEILRYAAGTDTNNSNVRYVNAQALYEAGNLALEPVKDIVSVGFYMKSGKETYIKNDINRSVNEIKESGWYQSAMKQPNTVCVGAYDTYSANDLFNGGKKDLLVLVFALAPDVSTDRSQKIEMVAFYQSTKAAERIKRYNVNYLNGENKLGITQITNASGELIFSTQEDKGNLKDDVYEKEENYKNVNSRNTNSRDVYEVDSFNKDNYGKGNYEKDSLNKKANSTDIYEQNAFKKDTYSKEIYNKNSYKKEYTCVTTSLEFNNTTWNIESYIKTSELTADFWMSALLVLVVATLVLLLSGYYSRYFLRSIVKPIEEISGGLRKVEEGYLDVHIAPSGQFEVRTMIHQFNAMVRRLKVLISEYEEKVKSVAKKPIDYFIGMIKGEITAQEVNQLSKEFFLERFSILGFYIQGYKTDTKEEFTSRLIHCFERNPRFASRCFICIENPNMFLVYYRITEEEYLHKLLRMAEELQKEVKREFDVQLSICIGRESEGYSQFDSQVKEIRKKMCLHHLFGVDAIIELSEMDELINQILDIETIYERLAEALYIADEKNMVEEKERLFIELNNRSMDEIKIHIYAIILAIGNYFSLNHVNFTEVFGQDYNYFDKVKRIADKRNLKLWLTNYFAWIMDYTASQLNVSETDVTVKAKRFIADNYDDSSLSLTKVAEFVGLNEKYFTTRFTKETGETFSSYLTGIRLLKSKELLKNTNFKVYEIAEMVGYHNVEHFNRMFKKLNGISPAQYRKTM